MSFENIVGQKTIIELLEETIAQDRVGHAYLFYGADGIGKATVAEAFAKRLMCTAPEDSGCCMKCEACVLNKNDTNPDLNIIDVPEGKASIGVKAIRDMQEHVITAPLYSAKKVYIIKHSDKMTVEAQNTLLKTLEEPPSYVVILLLCSNISLMLDTVKSRVNRLDFARYTDAEIQMVLERNMVDVPDDSGVFVYADGLPGRAISYFQDAEINRIRTELIDAIEKLTSGGAAERIRCTKYLSDLKTRKEFVFFTLLSFYRDIAQTARYGKHARLQNRQQAAAIAELARRIGFYKAEDCIAIIDRTWKRLKQNVNYDLAVSNMLIKIQEVLYD